MAGENFISGIKEETGALQSYSGIIEFSLKVPDVIQAEIGIAAADRQQR